MKWIFIHLFIFLIFILSAWFFFLNFSLRMYVYPGYKNTCFWLAEKCRVEPIAPADSLTTSLNVFGEKYQTTGNQSNSTSASCHMYSRRLGKKCNGLELFSVGFNRGGVITHLPNQPLIPHPGTLLSCKRIKCLKTRQIKHKSHLFARLVSVRLWVRRVQKQTSTSDTNVSLCWLFSNNFFLYLQSLRTNRPPVSSDEACFP